MFRSLKRATRRLLALLTVLPTTVLVLGTLYMLGITHPVGEHRTSLRRLQWASEALTSTTGHGDDTATGNTPSWRCSSASANSGTSSYW